MLHRSPLDGGLHAGWFLFYSFLEKYEVNGTTAFAAAPIPLMVGAADMYSYTAGLSCGWMIATAYAPQQETIDRAMKSLIRY